MKVLGLILTFLISVCLYGGAEAQQGIPYLPPGAHQAHPRPQAPMHAPPVAIPHQQPQQPMMIPQVHQQPQRSGPMPQQFGGAPMGRPQAPQQSSRGMPQQRFGTVQPGSVGPHGQPLVFGQQRGWHETYNRTRMRTIPFGSEDPQELETFIDTVNVSGPIVPLDQCTESCESFGAIAVSNDGNFGWAFNKPTAEAAKQMALNGCLQHASESCSGVSWASGTAWIAGVLCQSDRHRWAGVYNGNDAEEAITNVYRFAVQQRGYDVEQCALIALIAADGSHEQLE